MLIGEKQQIPFVCPECNYQMEKKHIIGKGEYDKLNSDFKYGISFECPRCFTKSKCHCETDYYIKLEINK